MDSKILFMGSAGDASIWGSALRGAGGVLLKVGKHQIILDPGPGCVSASHRFKADISETTMLLVSHAHINHCNDVNAVLSAINAVRGPDRCVVIGNGALIAGEGECSPFLTEFHKGLAKDAVIASQGKRIRIDDVEVVPLVAYHEGSQCMGFKIFTQGFVLSYSSDTKYHKDLAKEYSGSDILILHVKHPFSSKAKGGLTSADAVKILKKAQPKLCIITHFGKEMLEANPLYEAREIQKQTGIQVIAAEDGLEINPHSYAAQLKQKRIFFYEEN